MLKAVLFDMDGVLLDSEKLTAEASVMMFREKGFHVKEEDFLQFIGTGEEGYLGGIAKIYNIPFQLEEDRHRTYTIYKDLVRNQLKPLPGVVEFIDVCRKKGFKLAVATSAHRMKMMINLNSLGFAENIFDSTVSGGDVTHNKPHPEIYLKAASNLGFKASECLVVEDAINGLKAAKAAGCKCLALTTSLPKEKLSGADWIAENLQKFPLESINW